MIRALGLATVLLIQACGAPSATDPVPTSADPITGVYVCSSSNAEFVLVTRTVGDDLGVFLPPNVVPSAYQVLTPAGPAVWRAEAVEVSLGEDFAELLVAGETTPCHYDRRASIWEHAKLNGVSFRAVGNEPGWVLEIYEGDRLVLSHSYGAETVTATIAERRVSQARRTTEYRGQGNGAGIRVTLVGERCLDTMSGETFPTTVTVVVDETTLNGCGRPLH